jgi:signal transduction histidine kinase
MSARDQVPDPVDPGLAGLWIGILAYRWIALTWMTVLAATAGPYRSPTLATVLIVATIAWNVWWTIARGWLSPIARWVDLGLSVAIVLLSGVVQERGEVVGDHPFFATAYPASSAMTVGAAGGLTAGSISGAVLSIALALSRPLNGTPLTSLTAGQLAGLANGIVYYVSAGAAVGLVSRVLGRSRRELTAAREEATRERVRVARMSERESLGRQIHDSVLQSLALVNKRGRELAEMPTVPGDEVGRLAEIAGEQERALRAMVAGEPEDPPAGTVALRTVLQSAVYGVTGVTASVTTVDPVWLETRDVEELSAAVRQALENVVQHAEASRATVFGELDDGEIVVSVRDDGVGFRYDEERLRRDGKLGLLRSMKGRIEALGGSMHVVSLPDQGTEVEFRLPAHVGQP